MVSGDVNIWGDVAGTAVRIPMVRINGLYIYNYRLSMEYDGAITYNPLIRPASTSCKKSPPPIFCGIFTMSSCIS